MQDKIQKQLLDAFFVVLRPIAKILLRYGIGFREFAEVAKTAFVDVATTEFGIRGRPTNISRVAVMTGLTRKEIKRLRDAIKDQGDSPSVKTTPMTEVLHYWHADDEFLDTAGKPATLPYSGDERSFARIVKKYGGDVPPGAMRTELKRVGAIKEDSDGCLTVVKRSFRPEEDHDTLIMLLLQSVYPCLSTVVRNTSPETRDSRWTQRIAFSNKIKSDDISRLRRISGDRIAEFIQSVDDLLMAYESHKEDSDDTEQKETVVVGAFYFEEKEESAKHIW